MHSTSIDAREFKGPCSLQDLCHKSSDALYEHRPHRLDERRRTVEERHKSSDALYEHRLRWGVPNGGWERTSHKSSDALYEHRLATNTRHAARIHRVTRVAMHSTSIDTEQTGRESSVRYRVTRVAMHSTSIDASCSPSAGNLLARGHKSSDALYEHRHQTQRSGERSHERTGHKSSDALYEHRHRSAVPVTRVAMHCHKSSDALYEHRRHPSKSGEGQSSEVTRVAMHSTSIDTSGAQCCATSTIVTRVAMHSTSIDVASEDLLFVGAEVTRVAMHSTSIDRETCHLRRLTPWSRE